MTTEFAPEARQRPTLLTILCILSFIWAGFAVIGGGMGYVAMKMMASGTMEEMVAKSGDANAIAQYEQAQAELEASGLDPAQTSNLMLVSIGLALVALVGVTLMWRLKRTGFFMYSGAQVVGVAMPLLMGGSLNTSNTGIFILFITGVFIILYAVNLKHMS